MFSLKCEICGDSFEAHRKTRKYCHKLSCGKTARRIYHSRRNKDSRFIITNSLVYAYDRLLSTLGVVRITEKMAKYLKKANLFQKEIENGKMVVVPSAKEKKIKFTNTPSVYNEFLKGKAQK
jgi:hypothetical protein